jgi:predicted HTH transcriptional regulator
VSRYIHNLILQGEGQNLDFKFEISDAKKIARTLSAFANSNGGTLLIGVKDNGNISGIRTDEEAYMIEAAAELYCKPKVDYQIVPHQINDKNILEIKIPESKNKPHIAPWKKDSWKAFIRIKDQNFLATYVIYEAWKIKHRKKELIVRYDSHEEKLFELMKNKSEISLKDFIKAAKIPRYLAVKILAQLITIDVIYYRVTESETYYFLK